MSTKRVNRRISKKRRKPRINQQEIVSVLTRRSGPEQKQVQMMLPGINVMSSSTAGSVLAVERTLTPTTDVDQWANFQTIFLQYRVMWIKVQVIPVSNAAGFTNFFFNDVSVGVPSSTNTLAKLSNAYVNNSAACTIKTFEGTQSPHYLMKWKPADVVDQNWLTTGTAFSNCYLSIYGIASTHNTPASTALWTTRAWYMISFRGRE